MGGRRNLPVGLRGGNDRPSLRILRGGFSLTELLVVIAIFAIAMSFAVPAIGGLTSSLRIAQAGEGIVGQLGIARQRAITRNRTVEVRLYKVSGSDFPAYRAVWLVENGEGTATPIQRPLRLPEGIVIGEHQDLSSLVTRGSTNDPQLPFPGGAGTDYLRFHFYPNGSTDLDPATNWFLTLYHARSASDATSASPPTNYTTVQIAPKTGSVRVYRP